MSQTEAIMELMRGKRVRLEADYDSKGNALHVTALLRDSGIRVLLVEKETHWTVAATVKLGF